MVAQPDPDQITHPLYVVRQAVQIGGAAAIPGTIVGAFAGTLRTSTPILFSLVSGLQWFAIGSTFWTVRSSILNHGGLNNWWNVTRGAPLHPRTDLNPSTSDRVKASTISGGITGAVLGALLRGPRNVIPGTVMFSLFGFGGQHMYEWFDRRNTTSLRQEKVDKEEGVVRDNWLQRAAKSKWSPMSVLTDEDYERMLNEKLLGIEAEIALIDERIVEFKKMQKEAEMARTQQAVKEERTS